MGNDNEYAECRQRILKTISKTTKQIKKVLSEWGATEAAFNKFFEGEGIHLCPFCSTLNMFEDGGREEKFYFKKRKIWTTYRCLKCGRFLEKEGGEIPGKIEILFFKTKFGVLKFWDEMKKIFRGLNKNCEDRS